MSHPVPLQIRLPSALVNVVYILPKNKLQIPMLTVKCLKRTVPETVKNAKLKNKYKTVRGEEENLLETSNVCMLRLFYRAVFVCSRASSLTILSMVIRWAGFGASISFTSRSKRSLGFSFSLAS